MGKRIREYWTGEMNLWRFRTTWDCSEPHGIDCMGWTDTETLTNSVESVKRTRGVADRESGFRCGWRWRQWAEGKANHNHSLSHSVAACVFQIPIYLGAWERTFLNKRGVCMCLSIRKGCLKMDNCIFVHLFWSYCKLAAYVLNFLFTDFPN